MNSSQTSMESPYKRPKIEESNKSDESDVEILSPSTFKVHASNTPTACGGGEGISQDDEVMITSSNTINPNIDYVHQRSSCGVYRFNYATGDSNEMCCEKCYCYICDTLASNCNYWSAEKISSAKIQKLADYKKLSDCGPHCNAYGDKARGGTWEGMKEFVRMKNKPLSTATASQQKQSTVAAYPSFNPYAIRYSAQIRHEVLSGLSNSPDSAAEKNDMGTERPQRIPEILLRNFRDAIALKENSILNNTNNEIEKNIVKEKTVGDIPTLSLTPTFIEGIQIGFPFPKVMKPQRQIMFHLIRALKNKKHVVIESPTGTGKSAAILCSVLAWQRWHCKRIEGMDTEEVKKEGGGRIKVIYCSRTHSQVAQMVASLKSTPYRPRMAILGSRERLCIHKGIKPRNPGAEPITGINVNNECRVRVRNTEKYRKRKLAIVSSDDPYLDENPPDDLPGDGTADAMQDDSREGDEDNFDARSRMCPHYRQLTANRVANLAHYTFTPNKKVDCCSIGGKKSKYGAHDIEDLVDFGIDPYRQNGVALYRKKDSESFGLRLKGPKKTQSSVNGGCFVKTIVKESPADISGALQNGDRIVAVNGSDVTGEDAKGVAKKIKETSGDSLILDITRGESGPSSRADRGYSSHAACPYYISQALSKDADLVFAPYNYVLDPQIRNAMGLELNNTVVILDEGHNIESTLREAGSGRFGEFDLCDLMVMLSNYAITEKKTSNLLEMEGEVDPVYLCDVTHELLIFVEKLVFKLKESREQFEKNPGPKGANAILRDYEKFHTSDDTEFDISLHGPTGNGIRGSTAGCLPFFEQLGISEATLALNVRYVDAFEKFLKEEESNETSGERQRERDRISKLVDDLVDLVHKMCSARSQSEHYYAAIVACANGSLDFANGVDRDVNDDDTRRRKKEPRAFPLIAPRTAHNTDLPPNPCLHAICKARRPDILNPIRHGDSCDGSTPKWETALNLQLLTPGPLFQTLADECRTVVLASGSLAPIPSLCAELNLFSSDTAVVPHQSITSSTTPSSNVQKRLQTQPRPLEADHVVNLDKQLFVTSIGNFLDGSQLQVSHKNYSKAEFLEKLGDSIVKVVEGVPYGGVLVFLPSYSLLRKCERLWNPNGSGSNRRAFWSQFAETNEPSVWDKLTTLKHNVIVEPSGSNQTEFEEKKKEYMSSVDQRGGCVLFAVYRGKMSEGISFNDNYARCVICIGVPFPSAFSLPIKIKMNYNDEQRKFCGRTDLLPGREWYNQQAYRAIAQALGRCIRHIGDYGAIILMDARHCDDGTPNEGIPKCHKNLPKWMRTTVRNLSMNFAPRNSMFTYGSSSKTIFGGYVGLKKELQKFFRDAKPFVVSLALSQAARSTAVPMPTSQFTPPPGSSRAPLSISSRSSCVIPSVQHIQLSTTSKSNTDSLFPNDHVKVVPKQNNLMSAFQKQRENEQSVQQTAAKAPKVAKRSSTPTNLKTMFEKQLVGNQSKESHLADSNQKQDTNPSTSPMNIATQSTAAYNQDNLTSCTQEMGVTASQLQSVLDPSMCSFPNTSFMLPAPQQFASIPNHPVQGISDADENLCVICEDGKKQVVLLPCKHMCLCKACADFDKIKECPLCRTKVETSLTVFI